HLSYWRQIASLSTVAVRAPLASQEAPKSLREGAMSFHVAETPTLEAVATEDEQLLAQDLQARVEESASQAEAVPEVAEAAGARRAAQDRLDRLRIAERTLNRQAKESREQVA